ncbi:hypothetical protein BC828DRAFT_58502 [Blastocladiella britannica]|nr:hypothetical protein BC828DRAFT_58502 [Blastocladiella britannica]
MQTVMVQRMDHSSTSERLLWISFSPRTADSATPSTASTACTTAERYDSPPSATLMIPSLSAACRSISAPRKAASRVSSPPPSSAIDEGPSTRASTSVLTSKNVSAVNSAATFRSIAPSTAASRSAGLSARTISLISVRDGNSHRSSANSDGSCCGLGARAAAAAARAAARSALISASTAAGNTGGMKSSSASAPSGATAAAAAVAARSVSARSAATAAANASACSSVAGADSAGAAAANRPISAIPDSKARCMGSVGSMSPDSHCSVRSARSISVSWDRSMPYIHLALATYIEWAEKEDEPSSSRRAVNSSESSRKRRSLMEMNLASSALRSSPVAVVNRLAIRASFCLMNVSMCMGRWSGQ